MNNRNATALCRPPNGTITRPAQAKRESVTNWAGPMFDALTWEMIHPGQPRPGRFPTQTEDKQANSGEPTPPRADQTPVTASVAESAAKETPEEKPRKPRHSKPRAETAPTPPEDRRWLTVKETAQRYPYTEGALRHLIWEAEAYAKCPKSGLKSNGFLRCIVRPGGARRVLIDADQFDRWLQGRQPASN